MFYLLHRYVLLQRIIAFLLLAALFFFFFFHAEIDKPYSVAPLYKLLYNVFFASPTTIILLCVLLLVLQMLVLYAFNIKSQFSDRRSLVPICWYLLLTLVMGGTHAVSQIFFVNFISLLILYINKDEKENIKHQLYLSGFLVAVATMLLTSSVCLLFFLFIITSMRGQNGYKEFLVLILGFITPCFYLFAYCFLRNNMVDFVQFLLPENWICQYLQIANYSLLQYLITAIIILMYIYLVSVLNIRFQNKTLPCRQHLTQLHLFTFFMFLVSGFQFKLLLCSIIISFSCYYAIMCGHKKKWVFHDILLFSFIIIISFIKLWL